MKVKRIFAGLSAAVIAATMMAVSASATKLSDVVYPSKTETDKNDGWYNVGAMGFYMSQKWKWNQSEWFGINDEGKIELTYKISEVLTDTTMEGKGTLGDMGVMILNLPEDSYPYDVTISDAKFVTNDGEEIVLDSVNAITEATLDKEGGFRIHMRPVDAVDEDTGEVTIPAREEVAGWDQEGAFKGGLKARQKTLRLSLRLKSQRLTARLKSQRLIQRPRARLLQQLQPQQRLLPPLQQVLLPLQAMLPTTATPTQVLPQVLSSA